MKLYRDYKWETAGGGGGEFRVLYTAPPLLMVTPPLRCRHQPVKCEPATPTQSHRVLYWHNVTHDNITVSVVKQGVILGKKRVYPIHKMLEGWSVKWEKWLSQVKKDCWVWQKTTIWIWEDLLMKVLTRYDSHFIDCSHWLLCSMI